LSNPTPASLDSTPGVPGSEVCSMAQPNRGFRRRRKLIEPKLQLRLVATFLLVGAATTLLQAISLIHALNIAIGGPAGSGKIADEAPRIIFENLLFGFAICVPIVVVVGVFATFRMVGPAYRMRIYLQDLALNGYTGPCRIRSNDDFQGLCNALNVAVGRLRQPDATSVVPSAATIDVEAVDALLPSRSTVTTDTKATTDSTDTTVTTGSKATTSNSV